MRTDEAERLAPGTRLRLRTEIVTFRGMHSHMVNPRFGRWVRRALVTLPDGREASVRPADLRRLP